MTFSWIDLYYVSEWVVLIIMLAVILQRRRQPTAMAWLLIVAVMPWLGAVLYYLAGEKRIPRHRIRRHARLMKRLQRIIDPLLPTAAEAQESLPDSLTPAIQLARRVGHLPIVDGNHMELEDDSARSMERVMADIDAAEHHVHLLFYIFAADQTGRQMADCLKRAASRGVTCRVLVDSVGSRPMLKKLADELREAGADVREALAVGLFRRRLHRIDMRNHRKIVIIDSKVAYTGSQNIVDPGYGRKDLVWFDLMMRLTGPTVLELQAVFAADWYYESGELLNEPEIFVEQQRTGDIAIQTLPSGPNYPVESYHAMVAAALYQAQESVVITTPYFVPDDAMMRAIMAAHYRGVNVEIIVPRKSDHWFIDMASRAIYDELLETGIDVYFFHKGMLHAKTVTVDGALGFFGSSNFDIRSFSLNFEVNLMFYDRDATDQLRAYQDRYRQASDKQDPKKWENRPLWRRLPENFASLFSPVL